MKQLFKLGLPLVVFLLPLSVYWLTLYRTVAAGDSTEMVVAAFVLGVPHQPGYPLNTLIGHLFKNLPLPLSDVVKINLAAAVLQALGAVLFYWLMLELIKIKRLSNKVENKPLNIKSVQKLLFVDYLTAFTASMILAFSLIYWEYATKFEVFPLNNVLIILILVLSCRMYLSYSATGKVFAIWLTIYGIVWGLALTHHQTVVLIMPAAAVILWDWLKETLVKKGKLIPGLVRVGSGLLLGISVYFILILGLAAQDPPLNYGNIKSVQSAVKALVRSEFGTFSPYLQTGEVRLRAYPVDQIEFYLTSAVHDFSLVIGLFILLGLYNLIKNSRRVLLIAVTGIFMAGFVFLSYAGFPIDDAASQATVRRFYLLPNIFMAILIGFGLHFIYERLNQLRQSKNPLGINLALVYLSTVFLLPVYVNFKKADGSKDNLVDSYIKQAYGSLPATAIFMYSGDFTNMAADFFRYVVKQEPGRAFFSPGQFFTGWYIPQLIKRQPQLDIPVPQSGKRFTSTTQIAWANYGKAPIFINAELASKDADLEKEFTLYPQHLLLQVKKKGEDLKLEDWKKENEDLFGSINLELLRQVERRPPNFEQVIGYYYARHFYNSGYVFDEVGLYDEAIVEYERSLKIAPYFREAYKTLGTIYGEKKAQPDFGKALDYLMQYRSLLVAGEEEEFNRVQKQMSGYYSKLQEEIKKEAETSKEKEATESGSIKEATEAGERE